MWSHCKWPKNTKAWGSQLKLFGGMHPMRNFDRNEWGTIFERRIRFPLIHPQYAELPWWCLARSHDCGVRVLTGSFDQTDDAAETRLVKNQRSNKQPGAFSTSAWLSLGWPFLPARHAAENVISKWFFFFSSSSSHGRVLMCRVLFQQHGEPRAGFSHLLSMLLCVLFQQEAGLTSSRWWQCTGGEWA